MIVFIPWTEANCKPEEWLPRRCPLCQQCTVVGHGRRLRQAHDLEHDWILVRRGRCKPCKLTLTILPGWLRPKALYSLRARWDAMRSFAEPQARLEQCAPLCVHPDRIADGSTLRRWMNWAKRMLGFGCHWIGAQRRQWGPTILAWDYRQALLMLNPEAQPG